MSPRFQRQSSLEAGLILAPASNNSSLHLRFHCDSPFVFPCCMCRLVFSHNKHALCRPVLRSLALFAFFDVTADHDYAITAARKTARHFLTDPTPAPGHQGILAARLHHSSTLPHGRFPVSLMCKLIRTRSGAIQTPKNLRMAKPCAEPDQKQHKRRLD